MKQPTDFAKYISGFLGNYLTNEKGVSGNTIKSYSYTFILFINFIQEVLINYPLSILRRKL
jgi:integrase/recombinase XerD